MKKVRDDIYQVMQGFKPLKRGERRKGQSEWYYLDPRYKDDDAQKEIDVLDGEAPNPRLGRILSDDMQKNPDDYYIWRTKGDDKVRDRHKERDGKVFNWHIPPTGGHPGEDYNCRCWAEPYVPQKSEHKRLQIDLSGLHPIDELKPTKFDTKDVTLYAANDKANVASDVLYFKNMLTDEELLELMANNLLETEKMKDYIYLDKFGYITSGVGALLDDEKAFKSVPWKIGDRLATEAEVDAAYRYFVAKRFEKDDKGEFKNHNRLAESFKKECSLRVSKEYMVQRMMTHLREDLHRARKKRNDFDTYPIPLKLIILDFYYNKGSFYNQPGLPQALDAKDAKLFREKMMRNMADRDKWTKKQFNLISRNFWNAY